MFTAFVLGIDRYRGRPLVPDPKAFYSHEGVVDFSPAEPRRRESISKQTFPTRGSVAPCFTGRGFHLGALRVWELPFWSCGGGVWQAAEQRRRGPPPSRTTEDVVGAERTTEKVHFVDQPVEPPPVASRTSPLDGATQDKRAVAVRDVFVNGPVNDGP